MFGNLIKMRAYIYDLFFKDRISVPVLPQREKIYTCTETTFSKVNENINAFRSFSCFSCSIHAF